MRRVLHVGAHGAQALKQLLFIMFLVMSERLLVVMTNLSLRQILLELGTKKHLVILLTTNINCSDKIHQLTQGGHSNKKALVRTTFLNLS